MAKDFYEILGVGKNASKDEIKRAYRKLAQEHHPDRSGAGNDAKFKEVNQAYEVLSDDAKRSQYDRFGQTFESARGGQAGGFGGFSDFSDFMRGFGENFSRGPYSGMESDFGDIFSDIFGGGRRQGRRQGVDLEMTLAVDFLESVFGAAKDVAVEKRDACQTCKGSGAAEGNKVVTCPKCHGQGQIIIRRQTILGSIQQAETCDRCFGSGKIPEKECPTCRGAGMFKQSKTIKVDVPAGIADGQRIRLAGEGEMGYRGNKPGDLYINIRVKPHPEFRREGFDIYTEVPISFYQAALGTKIPIKTVDGEVTLKVPAGIQSGKMLRLSGKGVPHIEGRGRGDHYVTIRVVTPAKLNKKEKELFQKLAAENGESVDIDEGFWKKIRNNL